MEVRITEKCSDLEMYQLLPHLHWCFLLLYREEKADEIFCINEKRSQVVFCVLKSYIFVV